MLSHQADGERIEIQDDKLYHVVTDLYTGQMLGSVMKMSYGLLSLEPKDRDGNPIENLEDQAIMEDDRGIKRPGMRSQDICSPLRIQTATELPMCRSIMRRHMDVRLWRTAEISLIW